jgi:hypothetical protein
MAVTVVLARNPLKEFRDGRMSGRWGEMIAFKGPTVSAAIVLSTPAPPPGSPGYQFIRLDNRTLHLSTNGEPLKEVKRFTTMERFRADSGDGYYVQLRPKTDPYVINLEFGNTVVRTLRPGHDGRCFRIHGAKTIKEQAILIHEAPNVAFLIGCISPRPLHNFATEFENNHSNPASLSMNELIQFVGREKANFFVNDY